MYVMKNQSSPDHLAVYQKLARRIWVFASAHHNRKKYNLRG